MTTTDHMRSLVLSLAILCTGACGNELAAFEVLVEEVCACKDEPCANEQMKRMAALGKKLHDGKNAKQLKRLADRLATFRHKMETCTKRIAKEAKAEAEKEE